MLIGIHGRQQTGKDEVGLIIQYLTEQENLSKKDRVSFEIWKSGVHSIFSPYDSKMFGGKLKEILAVLLGVGVEKFECNTFKSTPLGHPWIVWKVEDEDPEGWTEDMFTTEEEALKFMDEVFLHDPKIYKIELTPRMLLQLVGENCFRQIIHPDTWVIALFKEYLPYLKWVITDLRYPNEYKAIKENGGICIKVIRPGYSEVKAGEKISDKALDQHDFDHYILNDKGVDELVEEVRKLLIKLKVIKWKNID